MVVSSWLHNRVIARVHLHPVHTMMQNSARWPPIFGTSRQTWAIGPPVGS